MIHSYGDRVSFPLLPAFLPSSLHEQPTHVKIHVEVIGVLAVDLEDRKRTQEVAVTVAVADDTVRSRMLFDQPITGVIQKTGFVSSQVDYTIVGAETVISTCNLFMFSSRFSHTVAARI